ncbi:MAG: hypothetical protein ACSHW4_15730 [Cellulophaga sp.]
MVNDINKFSICVYDYLGGIFSKKLRMSETGITDFLYNHIFTSTKSQANVRIFKIKSHIESIFGNDLDLFIKVGPNEYKWFVFQAKVMEYTGAFNDLKRKNKHSYPQWTKLKVHESLFGSEPYYLFYCGQPKVRSKKISGNITFKDCKGNANYRELGLSAVELDDVINNRNSKRISQLTYFNEFFPDKIKAFRYFFCKKRLNKKASRYYTSEEIIDTNYYSEVDYKEAETIIKDFESDNQNNIVTDNGQAKTRIIVEFKEE